MKYSPDDGYIFLSVHAQNRHPNSQNTPIRFDPDGGMLMSLCCQNFLSEDLANSFIADQGIAAQHIT